MSSRYREKAANGLSSIEEAIVGLLAEHQEGLINNEIARELKLESDFDGVKRII